MKFRWQCAASITLCAAALSARQAPYDTRDEIEGSQVSLAAFPIRPMAYRAATGVLWTINNHDHSLLRFQTTGAGASTSPNLVCELPWAPVAVAYWEGPNGVIDEAGGGDDELIVTCRGTWAVVSVSAATGRITDVVQLPASADPALPANDNRVGRMAEPGDVLVDSTNDRAFVSCTAADSVIQIQLDAAGGRKLVTRVYHVSSYPNFRCKSPLFLSFDVDHTVLVSPLTAGNNSTWGGALDSGTSVVTSTPSLPDEDLFRIDPNANTVDAVHTGLGSTIFAHDLDTVTNKVWVLNTNGLNTLASAQSEPQLTGDFLSQGAMILDAPVQMSSTSTFASLDPAASLLTPGPLPVGSTIGQPYALAFNGAAGGGQALIAGLLSDNVLLLASSGAFVHEFDLPAVSGERAIPRGVLVKSATSPTIGTFFAYAWGHNKVYEVSYDITTPPGTTTTVAYDLGRDPTPPLVRRGRAIFFNALNSTNGNLACASCHIDAGSDQLVWNLSHRAKVAPGSTTPVDDKGGMVTQTLVGLERLAPFHWRGERELVDFNPAFPGLLGGRKLPVAAAGQAPKDFDKFQAFLFSLVNSANPTQERDRVLPAAVRFNDAAEFDPIPDVLDTTPVITQADPARGQTLFNQHRTFKGAFACADCHQQPTGTNNGIHIEVTGSTQVRRGRLKPAAFTELWRKDLQPRLYVGQVNHQDDFQALLGAGFAHTGGFADLLEFVNAIFVDSTAFDPSDLTCAPSGHSQCVSDVTAFVRRWDSGLGQAAHFATRLAATQSGTLRAAIELELDYLAAQAHPGALDPWGPRSCCDIAVFGYANGSPSLQHWVYRRALNLFVNEDGTSTRSLQAFKTAAAVGGSGEDNVFVGLPVGRGEGFGVDRDNDGFVTAQDASPFDPTMPGTSTASALTSGSLSLPWTTTRTARLRFESDEPTTATVRYWMAQGPGIVQTVSHESLSRVHAFVLKNLQPSTAYGNPAVPIGTNSGPSSFTVAGEIQLTNCSGAATAWLPFSSSTPTKPFIVPTFDLGLSTAAFRPDLDSGDRQRHLEHIVSSSSFAPLARDSATGTITARVDIETSFKRGGAFNVAGTSFDLQRAPNRIVIGRVMSKKRAAVNPDGFVTPVSPQTLPGTLESDLARLETLTGKQLRVDGAGGVVGRLLVSDSPTSTANGTTSLSFRFTDPTLTTGDEVWFVIDAVVEVDATTWNGWSLSQKIQLDSSLNEVVVLPTQTFVDAGGAGNGQAAWTQWSFPDTKEDRALVKGTLP